MNNKIVYRALTLETWKQIVSNFIGNGYRWGGGDISLNERLWESHKKKSAIFIDIKDKEITYGSTTYADRYGHQVNDWVELIHPTLKHNNN